MKKLFTLGLILVLLSVTASAQRGQGDRFRRHRMTNGFYSGQLTRPERFELRKDQFRYKTSQRRARRDGIVTPFERRRLHKIKQHGRRDQFRFRHNGHRRVI
jgi:hypothetical protein